MTRLYEFVEKCLPEGVYEVTYEDMNEETEGAVGIYLLGSKADIRDLEGGTSMRSVKADLRIQARQGLAGIQEVSSYLEAFIDNIENAVSDIDGLDIISAYYIGNKYNKIKKNGFNIPIWKCEINIDYILRSDT